MPQAVAGLHGLPPAAGGRLSNLQRALQPQEQAQQGRGGPASSSGSE